MAIGNRDRQSRHTPPVSINPSDVADELSRASIEEVGEDAFQRRLHNDQIDETPMFFPSLWKQRRSFASSKLKEWGAAKVLDLGCGEGSLIEILLNDPFFEQLIGVDCDESVLAEAVGQCQPTSIDYVNLREKRLDLRFYKGSVEFADPDLLGIDAISCLEVIEHLDPHILDVFPHVTLGQYRPKFMIVSTPNSEFNIYFPHLQFGTPEQPLRHEDHRFEWTRQEFQIWAQNQADKYGYDVEFNGVGNLPESDRRYDVGTCSQIALFVRKSDDEEGSVSRISDPNRHYELFEEIEFPYVQDTMLSDLDILNEIYYWTETLVPVDPDGWARKGSKISVEQYWGIKELQQYCKTREKLIDIFNLPEAKESFALDMNCTEVTVLYDMEPYEDESRAHVTDSESDWGYCSDENLENTEMIYIPREPGEDACEPEDYYDVLG